MHQLCQSKESLFFKDIAGTSHGVEQLGLKILVDFLPQGFDVHVHHIGGPFVGKIPGVLQICSRDRTVPWFRSR